MSLTTGKETTEVDHPHHHRRRLGVPAVTFMIIAASAPLTVLAGGVTTTFGVTGVTGVPLSFLLLGGTLAVFAVGYAAMSRYVVNAGAFYSYVAQGISRPVGVGVSMVALMAYNLMQVGIYGLFGFTVSSLINERFGATVPWWIPVLVCIAVVAFLGMNRVDLSAKVLGVLVGLEFLVVIVYDIASFIVAPEGVSGAPLSPQSLFVPGVGAVLSFGIAAFMGFESAAIYGEESKDPKHTVARATYTAVAIIALFYAVSSWAMAVGTGPSAVVDASAKQGPDLMFGFLSDHAGVLLADLARLLFVTSLFAALVSFHNAAARYFFSLGREEVLPRKLSAVRRHSGAPYAGSIAQTVIAVVVTVAFAIAGTGSSLGDLYPVLTMFTWLTNDGAMGLVLLMTVVSLAVIGFFRKNRHDAGLWTRVVAPALGFVLLTAIFVLIVVNFNVLLGQSETNALTFILPATIIVPGLVGIAWAFRIRRNNPGVYRRIGHGEEGPAAVHLGDEEDV
ncbi:amino acid permease [Arthrobacter sp. SRS-W-1-2016]|uniref:APC family permease n=1 Tax=Arthrobacter sp. SRS-W-1-2016 TaxID=1930254 RepID=UPI000990FC70|nr:APC family permease [Arthrobacter sp. SRS-W-1-2016]OOP60679.1 amino acid permease [Arthrobacter sp. SRS-W-1-2016]